MDMVIKQVCRAHDAQEDKLILIKIGCKDPLVKRSSHDVGSSSFNLELFGKNLRDYVCSSKKFEFKIMRDALVISSVSRGSTNCTNPNPPPAVPRSLSVLLKQQECVFVHHQFPTAF